MMIASILFQFKQAWLSLQKRPGFIATVVTTMGITIGALICVLTLAYLLFFQPLPYPDQERLYQIHYVEINEYGQDQEKYFNFPSFLYLHENQKVFDETAIIYYTKNVVTSLPSQPNMPAAFISPELMRMLDVPMALGRSFDEREALNTNHPVAIINYDTWQNEYGADPEILNKKIAFKGQQFQIIGVTSQHFIEPQIYRQGTNTSLWMPWDFHLGKKFIDKWGGIHDQIAMIGKVKKDLTQYEVEQTLTPIMNNLWQNNKADLTSPIKNWSVRIALQPLSSVLLGETSNAVYFLLAGVLGLLLIASANITNLFVSRIAQQQHNLAIQAALGAKKSQLVRLILAESTLLMAMSILLALLVSSLGFKLIQTHLAGVLPRASELAINSITSLSALVFAGIAALLFTYISSKMINYRALKMQLQSSGKGTGIQVSKGIRQTLIASQVAIAMVLVFANLSLFNNAMQKITEPTGLELNNIIHASFSVSAPTYPDQKVVQPIMLELEQKILALPQVEQVDISASHIAPPWTSRITSPYTNKTMKISFTPIGDHYFSMAKQQLLEGNFFSKKHKRYNKNVYAIINDTMAKSLIPNDNAVGKRFNWGNSIVTIIGVVKAVKHPDNEMPLARMYVPASPSMTKMNIKLLPNQKLSRKEVVNAIKAVTPLYALYELQNVQTIQKNLLFTQYTTAITTASLATITLLLAAIGIYGILSYGTQMRRFEFGTRMAIGAKAKDLILLLIKDNIVIISAGIMSSILVLLTLFVIFYSAIAPFINTTLISLYLITLIAISALCVFSCYWPLRKYIKQPAMYSLRGSD